MATYQGEKYEAGLGNLRQATPEEASHIQIILDLKTKLKLINEEIAKRSEALPRKTGIVTQCTYNNETRYRTVFADRPAMLHVPVPACTVEQFNTTIADKKCFHLSD